MICLASIICSCGRENSHTVYEAADTQTESTAKKEIKVETDKTSEAVSITSSNNTSTAKEEVSTTAESTETGILSKKQPEETAAETEQANADVITGITAAVAGEHYIGTILNAADFDIQVHYGDGSVISNPPGWSATPLVLTQDPQNITVTYNGYSEVITVHPKVDDRSKTTAPSLAERTVEQTVPQTAARAPQAGTSYVLNTNSKKFHYPYCSSVNQMAAHNRQDVTWSREEVIAAGFVPCKNCNP